MNIFEIARGLAGEGVLSCRRRADGSLVVINARGQKVIYPADVVAALAEKLAAVSPRRRKTGKRAGR
ncbi:MAG: hypothetical protein HPY76_00970 [Anaerolineae bacterium]|jgi:hypothetical protein|nr:hypothetical protein [Anaerolineae bacterium]